MAFMKQDIRIIPLRVYPNIPVMIINIIQKKLKIYRSIETNWVVCHPPKKKQGDFLSRLLH